MKPEEINKTISKNLGWNGFSSHHYDGRLTAHRLHGLKLPDYVPNYAESLGACAEFERTITMQEYQEHYSKHLLIACCGDKQAYGDEDVYKVLIATPAKRCEAYLRMKGMWHE